LLRVAIGLAASLVLAIGGAKVSDAMLSPWRSSGACAVSRQDAVLQLGTAYGQIVSALAAVTSQREAAGLSAAIRARQEWYRQAVDEAPQESNPAPAASPRVLRESRGTSDSSEGVDV
jgi:hypothetical protein